MVHRVKDVSELDKVALSWLNSHPEPTACLLKGDMGSGKTTFIKAICNALNVTDQVTSPTFSLVNEYEGTEGHRVFHFDLYRLKSEEELFDIGFEEYLSQKAYVFIEWPDLATNFFITNTPIVRIHIENGVRIISFESEVDLDKCS